MFLKATTTLMIFLGFSCLSQAQVFWPEITIIDEEAQREDPSEPDGVIDGPDYYGLEENRRYDFTTRPQKQEEDLSPVEKAFQEDPYWEMYKNDYDSYQEIQTERLLRWRQKQEAQRKR